jgi:hypothetical protein
MQDRTTPTRFARNTGAAVVAGIAGWVSYWHQVEVALIAGERAESAHLIPLSVDGLLVVTSICMVDARQQGRRPHWVVRVGFAVGIAASIGANIAAANPTVLSRAVAGWPALALLLVVEALSRRGKLLPVEQLPTIEQPSVVAPVQQQAQRVVDRAATVLPVPVSPGPVGSDDDEEEERQRTGRGPIASRPSISPLTGRVLSDRVPRV